MEDGITGRIAQGRLLRRTFEVIDGKGIAKGSTLQVAMPMGESWVARAQTLDLQPDARFLVVGNPAKGNRLTFRLGPPPVSGRPIEWRVSSSHLTELAGHLFVGTSAMALSKEKDSAKALIQDLMHGFLTGNPETSAKVSDALSLLIPETALQPSGKTPLAHWLGSEGFERAKEIRKQADPETKAVISALLTKWMAPGSSSLLLGDLDTLVTRNKGRMSSPVVEFALGLGRFWEKSPTTDAIVLTLAKSQNPELIATFLRKTAVPPSKPETLSRLMTFSNSGHLQLEHISLKRLSSWTGRTDLDPGPIKRQHMQTKDPFKSIKEAWRQTPPKLKRLGG